MLFSVESSMCMKNLFEKIYGKVRGDGSHVEHEIIQFSLSRQFQPSQYNCIE